MALNAETKPIESDRNFMRLILCRLAVAQAFRPAIRRADLSGERADSSMTDFCMQVFRSEWLGPRAWRTEPPSFAREEIAMFRPETTGFAQPRRQSTGVARP